MATHRRPKSSRSTTPSSSPLGGPIDLDYDIPQGHILNPFTIAVDSNEPIHGHDWKFEGIKSDANRNGMILYVPLRVEKLSDGFGNYKGHGDYKVFEYPDLTIERKGKSDLFQSVANRENFKERLEIMQECYRVSFVVIECERSELRSNPPKFRDPKTGEVRTYPLPKVVSRSIISWEIDYPAVHWVFEKDRRCAEVTAFRILEKYWQKSTRKLR